MYFVDREKIERTLQFLEVQTAFLKERSQWNSPLEKAALERAAHTAIESVLDVGNTMIDGFIMRDPGSYDDIVDILEDEKVITADMAASLKIIIGFRKMLVQQYIDVDHEQLKKDFMENAAVLEQFIPAVRDYLTNELGPVSAFRN